MLPTALGAPSVAPVPAMTVRSTSEIAKMPIITGMKSMPASISVEPNVRRGIPAGLLRPTEDTVKPMKRLSSPRAGFEAHINTAQVRPSRENKQHTGDHNLIQKQER